MVIKWYDAILFAFNQFFEVISYYEWRGIAQKDYVSSHSAYSHVMTCLN